MHMYISLDSPLFNVSSPCLHVAGKAWNQSWYVYVYRCNVSRRDAVIMYCQSADTLKHCMSHLSCCTHSVVWSLSHKCVDPTHATFGIGALSLAVSLVTRP